MMWIVISIIFIILSGVLLFFVLMYKLLNEDFKIDINNKEAEVQKLKNDIIELKHLKDSRIETLQEELSKIQRMYESQHGEFIDILAKYEDEKRSSCIRTFTTSIPTDWIKFKVMIQIERATIDEDYEKFIIEESIRENFSKAIIDGKLYSIESDNIDALTNCRAITIRIGIAKPVCEGVIR